MAPFRFAVLYGSVRRERKGFRFARFLANTLRDRGHHVDLVDPLEKPLPLLDLMHKEYESGQAPANMEEIHRVLDAADGFIVVSGEYNHSIPPALKNLLDHYQREFHFKPAGIATYSAGSFGGVRAAMHLRAILGELGTVTPSIIMPAPKVGTAFSAEGVPADEAYHRRAKRFLDEFEWYADALREKRASGPLPF